MKKITAEELLKGLEESVKTKQPVPEYDDPFKVLITTILSQRTRDENTKKAAERLFVKIKTPQQLANAKPEAIEELIKPSGFYKIKTKRIQQTSKELMNKFGGKVPDKIEELIKLTGVGRKTANCVLVYGFKKPAIPVDVHVHRITNRMEIAKTKNPEETEKELEMIIPKKDWIKINQLMVLFGQQTCLPRNPKCKICVFKNKCEYGITATKK